MRALLSVKQCEAIQWISYITFIHISKKLNKRNNILFSFLLLTQSRCELATKTANTRHSRGQTFRIWSEQRKLSLMFAQTGPCSELEEKEYSSFWLFFERLSSFNVDGVRVTKKRLIWSFTFCLRAARCQHLDSSVAPWCQFFTMDVLFAAKQKNYYLHQQRIIVCSSLSPLKQDGVLLNSSSSWHFEEILTIEAAKRNIHWHLGFVLCWNTFERNHWIYSLKPIGLEIQLSLFVLSGLDHRCQDWLLGPGASQVPGVCQSAFHQSVHFGKIRGTRRTLVWC